MTPVKDYVAPRTLDEAVGLLSTEEEAVALAGGTDLLPQWVKGRLRRPSVIVDLKNVEDLRGISRRQGEVLIGACTPMSDIAIDSLIRTEVPALAEASGRIACAQIRNRATVGGNLCNASPAADTAVPLLLLEAKLDVASASPTGLRVREIPVTAFFAGPGVTGLEPGEVLIRVRIRPLTDGWHVEWDKFGTRCAMEIAVASVGLAVKIVDGLVAEVRVGYGSVAPVPARGPQAEAALIGRPMNPDAIGRCIAAARAEIQPIDDVRASASYRREILGVMLGRMLERAGHVSQAKSRPPS
ncbi:MAG: FAD binding domain-containing protein [Phycisphaerae bacterium]